MDKDYENFVGRMGSFEDDIDLESGEINNNPIEHGELMHYGKRGMRWGTRKGPSKSHQIKAARKRLPSEEKAFQEADKRYNDMMKKDRISVATYNKAAEAYNKAKRQRADTFTLAQQKTGGEKAAYALGTIGALGVSVALLRM